MSRTMIASGLHLDRAWSQLGAQFGGELRRWSRDALVRIVNLAQNQGAASLVVLGDLLDRANVVPDTIGYAASVLGAFPGSVLIVPGRLDWIGGPGPYELDVWQPNTRICRTAGFSPWEAVPEVLASAWTSPAGSEPPVPRDFEPNVLMRPAAVSLVRSLPPESRRRFVTTDAAPPDGMTALPDLVTEPGDPGGFVLIHDSVAGLSEQLTIPGNPGRVIDVDVTGCATTAQLALALSAAVMDVSEPVMLRLSGDLAPRVLLPGFGGPDLPPEVATDFRALRYQVEPDSGDHSAEAEFIRAMAGSAASDLERHQAIALGLTGLDLTSVKA